MPPSPGWVFKDQLLPPCFLEVILRGRGGVMQGEALSAWYVGASLWLFAEHSAPCSSRCIMAPREP